ncbi:LATE EMBRYOGENESIS ABUNDANT PROTEIN (LEA) FAMILY PROTEIN [Salix viminalis]|nr:LATE EMBRYOGENESIS ABUNDANT PROTEIN (LEA) FAMILY PROTEIN [Salix viminalis]
MTDKMSYQAGEAKGQTQEKASTLMDKAGNAAQSAKETVQAKTETSKMPGNTQKTNFQAGEAKGQTQEKASTLMDKAGNAAQSAKETVTAAGQQVMATAQGAVEGVKNATGMNK